MMRSSSSVHNTWLTLFWSALVSAVLFWTDSADIHLMNMQCKRMDCVMRMDVVDVWMRSDHPQISLWMVLDKM
jgi:hypothetical protein